jgi:hypothetical protein
LDDSLRYEAATEGFGDVGAVWFEVNESHGSLVSDVGDAALVGLLVPAMAQGGELEVKGPISDRLVFNLGRLQAVLRLVMPQLRPLQINVGSVVDDAASQAPGVATGFSAGVDSYAALADYHFGNPPPRFRLTHLLFNNVGAHWAGGDETFHRRYERLRPIAERMGLPFVKVNSNLDAFYAGFTFESTHTFRNAAVALLLQRGIGTFLYASGYGYADTFVGEASSSNHSEAVTLPLMSTGAVSALSVGSEYSRVEKTLKLTSIPDTHDSLDVCFFEHAGSRINCSICEKCLRTMFTLELAGALDKYSKCFDKVAYMQHRENYLADLLGSASPLACELIHYASQISFEFPNTSLAKHRHRQRHKWHPVRIARGVSAKIRSLTR